MRRAWVLFLGCLLLRAADRQLARDIFQQLIEINTTDSTGSTTAAAEAMAARLRDAGYPPGDVRVLGPNPRKGNLVARLRGTGGGRPILLLAHLDVVEARRADWSFDPFRFIEKDGYYYGRGTNDNKSGDAILTANMIRLKREGLRPRRDLVMALTADEEGGAFNGVDWLLKNHRDLIDAEYCVNTDAGDGQLKNGRRVYSGVEAAEKVYLSFRLAVTNKGGHSSLPPRENAIYRLAAGLMRLSKFEFPVRLNEVTHSFFERMASIEKGAIEAGLRGTLRTPPDSGAIARLSASPFWNAQMRTTCIPTLLEAGHAENALPQSAVATVNCRMLPDEAPDNVEAALRNVLNDEQIVMSRVKEPVVSPVCPLKPEIMRPIQEISAAMWPGLPVIPVMDTGATDGVYTRQAGIPTYGVSGLFYEEGDVRAHGRDERVGVEVFHDGLEFYYRLLKTLARKPAG